MVERVVERVALNLGLSFAFLFCLPSLLPILAALLLSSKALSQSFESVDWMASVRHSFFVAVITGIGGAWTALSIQYSTHPPWRILSIWLVLAALVPAALLAQCLALALSFTGGTGQSAALLVGHILAIFPMTFVLMLRHVALDGAAHYLAVRNLGASDFQTKLLLIRHHYPTEVSFGSVLAFFVSFNESAIAGSLGGNTAYFGSVMNAAAFGSADPSTMIIGGGVELFSVVLLVLYGISGRTVRP